MQQQQLQTGFWRQTPWQLILLHQTGRVTELQQKTKRVERDRDLVALVKKLEKGTNLET